MSLSCVPSPHTLPGSHSFLLSPETEIQGMERDPMWPESMSPADKLQAKVDRPGAQGAKLGAAFLCW